MAGSGLQGVERNGGAGDRIMARSDSNIQNAAATVVRTCAGFWRPPLRWALKPLLEWRAARIARGVAPLLSAGELVLDFGTGDGVVAQRISQRSGCEITGLDTIRYGDPGLSFIPYDGRRIPVGDGEFDTVMALFALHHCADVEASLAECRRVARKRLLVVEEVYVNRFEELFTKAEDWVANRILSGAVEIPLHFKPPCGWKELFARQRLALAREARLRPLPFLPLRTVLYELHKV